MIFQGILLKHANSVLGYIFFVFYFISRKVKLFWKRQKFHLVQCPVSGSGQNSGWFQQLWTAFRCKSKAYAYSWGKTSAFINFWFRSCKYFTDFSTINSTHTVLHTPLNTHRAVTKWCKSMLVAFERQILQLTFKCKERTWVFKQITRSYLPCCNSIHER